MSLRNMLLFILVVAIALAIATYFYAIKDTHVQAPAAPASSEQPAPPASEYPSK